ncbi:BppU family phage baseplate upper protein [Weissella confusa]|uniref:BppU family phage baseplate upper protein n=1 Tax=Weissella confusa TaxID=1583 RepID=UPI0018F11E13|nr:BppU family phage baseplate upper protein [Weissella confusa]MBJ7690625.1 BppU family phage baseplate upper protein [Weissella confusa]MBJ7701781.1 BppU family phage baseplate upper protein [Weissella confusa]
MAKQAQSQGRYAVVNTLLDTTDVTLIDSLSGRQGDNSRIVYFAIKDGNLPHNLDGQNVVLTAKDSAGKVKQISGVQDMISSTGGLFSMLIPGEMYQSAGDVEEAYLSVQDGVGTVISSIPVTFTVLANNILFTANASKDYIDSVQQAINEANSRISGLNDNIKAQQLAYETLKTSVENLAGQIDSKQVSMLNVANHFTETATFDKGVITPKFKADSVKAQQSHDGNIWHDLADDDAVVHKNENEVIPGDKIFTGNTSFDSINSSNVKTSSVSLGGLTFSFRQTAVGVNVLVDGSWQGSFGTAAAYVDAGVTVPTNISAPLQGVVLHIVGSGGTGGVTLNAPYLLEILIGTDGKLKYRARNMRENDTAVRVATIVGSDSAFYALG